MGNKTIGAFAVLLFLVGISFATQIADVPAENPYGHLTWTTTEIEKPFSLTVLDSQVGPTWIYFKLNASVDKDACAEKQKTQKVQIDDSAMSAFSKLTSLKVGGSTVISDSNTTKDAKDNKTSVPWAYSIPDLTKMDCGSSKIIEANLTRDASIPIEEVQFIVKWGTNSTTISAAGSLVTLGTRALVRWNNGTMFAGYQSSTAAYIARSDNDGATWNATWFNISANLHANCNTTYSGSPIANNRLGIATNGTRVLIAYNCYNKTVNTSWQNYGFMSINSTGSLVTGVIYSAPTTGNAIRPDLTVAANGTIYATLNKDVASVMTTYITNSTDGGATWGTAIAPKPGAVQGGQDIQSNGAQIFLYLTENSTGMIIQFNGTTWSATNMTRIGVAGTTTYFNSFTADAKTHIAFIRTNDTRLCYDNSDGWASETDISGEAVASGNIASSGANIIVLWVNANNTLTKYRISTDSGGTWGATQNWTPPSGYVGTSGIFRYDSNNNPNPSAFDLLVFASNGTGATVYDRLGTFLIQTNNGTETGSYGQQNITGIVVYSAGDLYTGGESTCNITSLNASRLMTAGTLVVRNSSGSSVAIVSNATTWVTFLCNQGENNYSVEYQIPYVTFGAPSQSGNATVPNPVLFLVTGNSTGTSCNYTSLPADRLLGANTLWITNGTGSNVTIASNATTWASFLCNLTGGGYTISFKMPAPTENCTAAGGEVLDLGNTSTVTTQYSKRNCTLTNPSTLNYTNVSGSIGCIAGGTCNLSSQSNASMVTMGTKIQTQGAYGSWLIKTLNGWVCAGLPGLAISECNETMNLNSTTTFNMTNIQYDETDYDACPPGGYLCSFAGAADVVNTTPTDVLESIYDSADVITGCGLYFDDNANYFLVHDLTSDVNTSCLTFIGTNQSFNGAWHTLASNQTGAAITANGINQTISNVTVSCINQTDVNIGLYLYEADNVTFSFIKVKNCEYGLLAAGAQGSGSYVTSVDISNSSFRHIVISADVDYPITFTNVNTHKGNVTQIAVASNGSTVNYADGGFNYWANCSGNCSWYTINRTTNESSIEDNYVDSAFPSDNFGTAPFAPSTTTKLVFYKMRNISFPPGRILSVERLNTYITDTAAATFFEEWVNGTWTENTTTWASRPTIFVNATSVATGGAASQWVQATSAINQTNFAVYGGAFMMLNATVAGTWTAALRENGTYLPYMNLTWRYANGNPATYSAIPTSLRKDFLSMSNATYCSVEMPSSTIPRIKYYVNDSTATTTYYEKATNNTGLSWFTFPCDASELYYVETDASTYATTAASCVPGTHQSSVYYFLDETTEANTTANATVYITIGNSTTVTSLTNTMSFRICMSDNVTTNASIQTRYSNTTTSTRINVQNIDQTTDSTLYLYLLSTTDGVYYTFRTVTSSAIPIENASLYFYKYSVLQSAWVITEQGITDFSGYSTILLEPFTPYQMFVSAAGFQSINVSYTPNTVTSLTIQLYGLNNTVPVIPNFDKIWNSTAYSLTPSPGYHPAAVNFSYMVADVNGTSAIEYYGWNITKTYNGSTTGVAATNITVSTNGGILNATNESGPGQYVVKYWFKRQGFTVYRGTATYYVGNSSGVALSASFIPSIISPWAYIFFAIICAMLAAGYASRYTVDGAAVVGLIVLTGFVAMWVDAPLDIGMGATTVPFYLLWFITSITVFLALAYRWVY